MQIPASHQSVMPYLLIENAQAFIDFAEKLFQGNLTYKAYREDGKTIMHAEVTIAGQVFMLAEATADWQAQPGGFFIYVEEADNVFNKALTLGAEEIMPMSDQSYGRSGGVKDPFGNVWWITSVIE